MSRRIAERAASFGLFDGLLVVRSRNGGGLHVLIVVPEPITLDDAVLAVAFLSVQARRIADEDVADYEREHAFRTGLGTIAEPGASGIFELFPRNSERPALGYPIALPFSAVSAQRGGGDALDIFSAPPAVTEPRAVPVCQPDFWRRFMDDARCAWQRKQRVAGAGRGRRVSRGKARTLDPRTEQLLAGAIAEGNRNKAVYFGYLDLIRTGVHPNDAESAAVAGGQRCGLARREAEATARSAARRWEANR